MGRIRGMFRLPRHPNNEGSAVPNSSMDQTRPPRSMGKSFWKTAPPPPQLVLPPTSEALFKYEAPAHQAWLSALAAAMEKFAAIPSRLPPPQLQVTAVEGAQFNYRSYLLRVQRYLNTALRLSLAAKECTHTIELGRAISRHEGLLTDMLALCELALLGETARVARAASDQQRMVTIQPRYNRALHSLLKACQKEMDIQGQDKRGTLERAVYEQCESILETFKEFVPSAVPS